MFPYFLLVFGFLILLPGGKLIVDGTSFIALKLGLSSVFIGVTITAIGTSRPKLET